MSLITTPPNTEAPTSNALSEVGFDAPPYCFSTDDHALIIGAGLAGCAIAKTLAASGMRCTVFDQHAGVAQAASSVPAAIYKPYLSRKPSIEQSFIDRCFDTLVAELERLAIEVLAEGVLQQTQDLQAYSQSNHWQHAADHSVEGKPYGWLHAAQAGALTPSLLCSEWIRNELIQCCFNTSIGAIRQQGKDWVVTDTHNHIAGHGQLVILANAMSAAHYAPELLLTPVSGQINCFDYCADNAVYCDKGYVISTSSGVWSGATFRRHSMDTRLTETDELDNLRRCQQTFNLPLRSHNTLAGWAGIRCTTQDRLPVVGAVPDASFYQTHYGDLHLGKRRRYYLPAKYQKGLYVLAGLGARGLVQALYSAECLADCILGRNATDQQTAQALHPARFLIRKLRRGSA